MKKVMVFLDDDTASGLERLAKDDYRSVKSMAEKVIMENVKRSDGFTDAEYLRLKNGAKKEAYSG